eukprot:217942-Chlamydomonas_euryale.AAC.2
MLLHDFPEFLCEQHHCLCDAIPTSCVQASVGCERGKAGGVPCKQHHCPCDAFPTSCVQASVGRLGVLTSVNPVLCTPACATLRCMQTRPVHANAHTFI